MDAYKYIGHSVVKVDGKEKVSGAALFTDDLEFGPDLLYAEVVEGPHAHAMINSINISDALKVPEVLAVVTGKDFPYNFGLYMNDRYIFAQDRVRFFGEQIAAVIARTPQAAKKAAQLVKVSYTPLPKVLSPLDAIMEGAEILHPDLIQ